MQFRKRTEVDLRKHYAYKKESVVPLPDKVDR